MRFKSSRRSIVGKLLHGFLVHGTTGYEWMNAITQVLTDGRGLEPLDEIWRQVSNQSPKLEADPAGGKTPRAGDAR